ncbi:hypothetical protein ESZ50_04955 [Weissella muntiaci]|uniref:ImmA/IrrE family metallo-endopeptidase n=1 Tax=Weissella muntiaci TaxID=2508881 RepID=A0A6C2C8I2_9LACO|nr:hypothetical protein [Weissella muntiaci]TYC49942.1 hypothetical protein ESZ50_04955 [Weissella muntiaci]
MRFEIIAESYGVLLLWVPSYAPFNSKGKYNPDIIADVRYPNGTIFIKDNLNEEATLKVLLHELGHEIDGIPLTNLSAPQQHLSNEALANRYMVHNKAKEWLTGFEGNYPVPIDVTIFLKWSQLSMEFYEIANREITELITPHRGSLI